MTSAHGYVHVSKTVKTSHGVFHKSYTHIKHGTIIHGDVSNQYDLDRLYDTVKQQKGRIDVLFANAGLWDFGAAF
ncbi:MAG: hypothetical protein WBF33_15755 [Candidatus Nitrosopolaris sp.]